MHFLFLPYGTNGDVYPYVGIGVGLKRRGHRVTFITHTYFRNLLARFGLDHVDLNDQERYQATVFHPSYWDPRRGVDLGAEFLLHDGMRKQYAAVERLYVPGETVAVATVMSYGALVAEEKLGLPVIHTFISPFQIPSVTRTSVQPRHDWVRRLLVFRFLRAGMARFIEAVFLDRIMIGPEMNRFREEIGLPPTRHFLRRWLAGQKHAIGLYPRWLAEPVPDDWPPIQFTEFPFFDEPDAAIPGEVGEFLESGSPPIAFSPGSATTSLRHFFQAAVDACRLLDRRGLLMTRFPEQLPADLPTTIKYVPFAPHSKVLPRCAALVSHGGIGTVSQGLRAGIPQVCMPLNYDQPDNASRCERLGVARTLPPRRFTGPGLARQLQDLLTSASVRTKCRRLAASVVCEDPVKSTCDLMEEMAKRGRSSF